ncbi:MAG TPA: hypothetical protein VGX92_06630 [Pyrinomonadaceae bacterium]|nr:hypothetical protein [Pyrinomonadaceae bacterium]
MDHAGVAIEALQTSTKSLRETIPVPGGPPETGRGRLSMKDLHIEAESKRVPQSYATLAPG